MHNDTRPRIVRLVPSAAARRRARREADRLVAETITELTAYLAGDGLAAWDAHRAMNTFMKLVMAHQLDLPEERAS